MTQAHVGELKLRTLRAGELDPAEAGQVQTHLEGCADCRRLAAGLEAEEREFHARIPFDRFARGVEGAVARQSARAPASRPAHARSATTWSRWFVPVPLVAAAAMAVLLVVRVDDAESGGNRVKGTGAGVTLRIASGDDAPQRTAVHNAVEVLTPGERIRIGYRPGPHRYLLAVSIDERGEVSALYPESGSSLPTGGTEAFLPDSVEFTGRGGERVIVVMTEVPLEVNEVTAAARRAYDAARGNVERLPALELPVASEQFHQNFLKP